jgi:hypothetical protein
LKVEFINFNNDPDLDPEIMQVPLSKDSKNKPPSYCLPWVEAARYSIQLKSNEEYIIHKKKSKIEAWIVRNGKELPASSLWMSPPEDMGFVPKNDEEIKKKKIHLGFSPSFSSPWQRKRSHSITLKLGIYWWTPPGWGMFFTSAVHRNENFRIVEGFVRTDLWHRDIPIVLQPLVKEVHIPKYTVVASVLVIPIEDIELCSVAGDKQKIIQLVNQVSLKRINNSIYKDLVKPK